LLLQKTMVVVEGVARSFDPRLDIWTTAEPVVREWIERNLGPIGKIEGAVSGASDLGKILSQLPGIAGRAVMLLERMDGLTRNGLQLSPDSIEALSRSEQRHNRWLTAGVWLIGIALVAAVWILR
jgi:ubiquinone biosynthesis protein